MSGASSGYERLEHPNRFPAWGLFKKSFLNARNIPNLLLLGALGRRPITLAKLVGLKNLLKPSGFIEILLPIIIVLLIADTLYTTFHLFKDNYGIDKNKKLRAEYEEETKETLAKFPAAHTFIGKPPELSRPENDFKHVYPAVQGYITFFRRFNLLKVGFRAISLMVTLPYIFGATLPLPITMAVGGAFGFFLGLWVDYKDDTFNEMRDNEARETSNAERMLNYYKNELQHMENTEELKKRAFEEGRSCHGSPLSPVSTGGSVLYLRTVSSNPNLRNAENADTPSPSSSQSHSPTPPADFTDSPPNNAKLTKFN